MEPDKSEKPKLNYGPFAAIFIGLGSFIGGQFFASLAISLWLVKIGWSQARIQDWAVNAVEAQAFSAGLAGLISISVLLLFLKSVGNKLNDIGLKKPKLVAIAQALLGFAVYLGSYLVIVAAVKALIPDLNLEQEQELGFDFSVRQNLPFFIFSLIFVAPLVEEILMRGFLFSGLRTKLPFVAATIITSSLFAAAHLPAGKDGLLWVGAVDTFVLSVVLCYLREKTGSLWAPILVHAMKNSLALIFLVYLS